MKKVSTAVTMQSRNISQQKLTIGLDLGDRNSWEEVLPFPPILRNLSPIHRIGRNA